MSVSILNGTKKILGLSETYLAFDQDVLTHINSIFSVLNQLGIGPELGFRIDDATATWDDFLADDPRFNMVQTYMYLRVRLLFDPPTTGYLVTALTEQYQEMEWRLNEVREMLLRPLSLFYPVPDPEGV